MQYPLARLSGTIRGRLLTIFLVGTLALWAVSWLMGAHLTTNAAPAGIISFELAGSLDHAQAIMRSWDMREHIMAAFGLGLDYLFLIAYSTFFGLACLSAGDAAKAVGSHMSVLAIPLAWGQWLAAGLDAVENVALVSLLLGSTWPTWPPVAWFCSSFKFALIGAALIYIVWGAGLRTLEDFLTRDQ
ncbi:MAG TPA: hypothetical protein VNT01_10550 [Symbiobacteriaceae bacterium]|nr:hypothetical protein [Symbiobacteriaceae bacterium]